MLSIFCNISLLYDGSSAALLPACNNLCAAGAWEDAPKIGEEGGVGVSGRALKENPFEFAIPGLELASGRGRARVSAITVAGSASTVSVSIGSTVAAPLDWALVSPVAWAESRCRRVRSEGCERYGKESKELDLKNICLRRCASARQMSASDSVSDDERRVGDDAATM